jgi:hypothetical protein
MPLEKKQEYAVSYQIHHQKSHTKTEITAIIVIPKPKKNPMNMPYPILPSTFYDGYISYF